MDWREYKKSVNRPSFISAKPDAKYKNERKGWSDFFGVPQITYYTFYDAKKKAALMEIKTSRSYKKKYKLDKLIPAAPQNIMVLIGKVGKNFSVKNRLCLSSFGTKRVEKTTKSRKEYKCL